LVDAQKTGPDTYIGVVTKRFDVANHEQVSCALKTRDPLPVKVLALEGSKYACHKPADLPGSADFVPETRPDPAGPRPPRIVIDPPHGSSDPDRPGKIVDPPRLSCAGGTPRYGQCQCPSTHKAVRAGKNAWRCVRAVVDPPRASGGAKIGSRAVDARPARVNDLQAERRRLDALKKAQQAKRQRSAGKKKAAR
jgi:hypothetical protein